jgi:fatty acid CoA ligase FadD9
VLDDSYASGYAASKWAGEVLLREAHDAIGLPVTVFRSDMILAHPSYRGQLNLPDMFTRLLFSLIVTGIAPPSFYRKQTGHYDGLPVDFIAEAVTALGSDDYDTYNVVNPHDDGIGLDAFVDWLVKAGYPVQRLDSFDTWFARFAGALRALPERQRKQSLLPLLAAFAHPEEPTAGLPAERFRAAVQKTGRDIPHITEDLIRKYAADLAQLDLIQGA